MDGQLSIAETFPLLIPKPLLVKDDRLDGWIYICPNCKTYNCGGNQCAKCGQEFDRKSKALPYKGKYSY